MDNTRVMNGAKAPAPAQPGQGGGNRPYAPGLISGKNLGQQNTQTPLARQTMGGRPMVAPAQPPPSPAPPGEAPQAAPPPGAAGPFVNPAMYMQILDEYMKALIDATQNGNTLIRGLY
jgi:hypothetical protein